MCCVCLYACVGVWVCVLPSETARRLHRNGCDCGHVADGGRRSSSQCGAVFSRRARDEELISEYFVYQGKIFGGETCVSVPFGGLYIRIFVHVCA